MIYKIWIMKKYRKFFDMDNIKLEKFLIYNDVQNYNYIIIFNFYNLFDDN